MEHAYPLIINLVIPNLRSILKIHVLANTYCDTMHLGAIAVTASQTCEETNRGNRKLYSIKINSTSSENCVG